FHAQARFTSPSPTVPRLRRTITGGSSARPPSGSITSLLRTFGPLVVLLPTRRSPSVIRASTMTRAADGTRTSRPPSITRASIVTRCPGATGSAVRSSVPRPTPTLYSWPAVAVSTGRHSTSPYSALRGISPATDVVSIARVSTVPAVARPRVRNQPPTTSPSPTTASAAAMTISQDSGAGYARATGIIAPAAARAASSVIVAAGERPGASFTAVPPAAAGSAAQPEGSASRAAECAAP